jgi:hypothetical protein
VPKCENYFYFYTRKPLWVGGFRAKKKFKILIFRGSFGGFFFENFVLAQAECVLKKIFFQARAKILSAYVYTSGFWPRVRARALRAPVFWGPLKRQTGAARPPHRSFAAPQK